MSLQRSFALITAKEQDALLALALPTSTIVADTATMDTSTLLATDQLQFAPYAGRRRQYNDDDDDFEDEDDFEDDDDFEEDEDFDLEDEDFEDDDFDEEEDFDDEEDDFEDEEFEDRLNLVFIR